MLVQAVAQKEKLELRLFVFVVESVEKSCVNNTMREGLGATGKVRGQDDKKARRLDGNFDVTACLVVRRLDDKREIFDGTACRFVLQACLLAVWSSCPKKPALSRVKKFAILPA